MENSNVTPLVPKDKNTKEESSLGKRAVESSDDGDSQKRQRT